MTDINHIKEQVANHQASFLGYAFESSVLLPLVYHDDQWQILYQVRSPHVSQPGEVSFPGGRLEPGETPLEAALRETEEEIGFPVENIEVLGEIDRVANGKLMVYCHVGILKDFDESKLNINHFEVDSIFFRPVDFFIENPPKIYQFEIERKFDEHFPSNQFQSLSKTVYKKGTTKSSLPYYDFHEATLWGLTAQLTRHFVELIK